ncbi:MAG TPA: class I SAM-dependent methyltransferase [Myxococcota bacterium]|nr:class I SAM-dependent methyltransferase [Myxococcota bacterium]HQK52557.1 class I SAM-dependent methyltransferase [Myxococcota bacterium]
MDPRDYYDVMSRTYEDERHHGYHRYLDEAEVAAVADLVRGREVLEVGCGTGLILQRLAGLASRAVGVDLSPGMLRKARERGLEVLEGRAEALPFPDASFDVAVSFKVLAHVPDVRAALAEMARVVRPGGAVAAEFYNRHSLRYLVKRLKPPTPIDDGVHDEDVTTRYDTLDEVRRLLPQGLRLERVRGIRVAIPAALLMRVPVLGAALAFQDRVLGRLPGTSRLGGFLVVVARKAG